MSFDDAADRVIKSTNRYFGKTVIYTYASNSSTTEIQGVFDNAFVVVNDVSTKKPILRIRLDDLDSEPVDGDKVYINSVEYFVRDHEPNSHGSTTLILEKI